MFAACTKNNQAVGGESLSPKSHPIADRDAGGWCGYSGPLTRDILPGFSSDQTPGASTQVSSSSAPLGRAPFLEGVSEGTLSTNLDPGGGDGGGLWGGGLRASRLSPQDKGSPGFASS